jgi:hypothetical protein
MIFFTWNSQGDFTATAKSAVVQGLFNTQNCSVGFIQEGGVDKDKAVITANVNTYGGPQVGAKNERCTNYVLVKTNLFQAGVNFEHINAIGGGEAGRAAAAVRIGNTIYASWHSLSGPSNSDTAALINECKKKKGVDTIVIGGDFNTGPDEILGIINRNASAGRGRNDWFCSVFKSGQPTHRSGRELDYFLVLSAGVLTANPVTVTAVPPSDHDPVLMNIPAL